MPGEAREDVRIVERGLDVVLGHVGEPRGLVVGAGPEVFVDSGHVALLVARRSCGRVQEAGGSGEIVEDPHVAPLPIGNVALEAVVAALELEPNLLADGPRASVANRRGELLLPELAWFEHVIVDGDDQREIGFRRRRHGKSLLSAQRAARAGARFVRR